MPKRSFSPVRIFARILVFVLAGALASIFYLSTLGFPDWLVANIEERMNTGMFVFETGTVKLDPTRGIVLNRVRLYRKRIIGPPAVEVEQVVATIDPFALARNKSFLRKLKVKNGIFRPRMGQGPEPEQRPDYRPLRVQIELDHCIVQGLDIESLSCTVVADMHTLRATDVHSTVGNKDLHGILRGRWTYHADTRVLEGHVDAKLDPYLLLPLIKTRNMPYIVKLINRFTFGEAVPECKTNFRKVCVTNGPFTAEGTFQMKDSTYREVDILRANGGVSLAFEGTNGTVTVDQLLIVRPEGNLTGRFALKTVPKRILFEGTSGLNPKALVRMIGIMTNHFQKICRFDGPVKITARGTVDYGDRTGTDFGGTVIGRDMSIHKFTVEEYSFSMHMSGLTNTLLDIRGRMYGGDVTGLARFVLPSTSSTNMEYRVEGTVERVDVAKLTKAVMKNGQKDYKGKLSGTINVEGLMGKGNASTARGKGYMSIKDGRVFLMPVFGGLSTYLTRIIPGLDFVLRQSDVKADFTIADGKLHTDKTRIEGDILSLSGHGDYYFNKELDFHVQIKLMKEHTLVAKLIRVITYPISKLFEFRLRGTYDNANWYPVNFSKDLLEKLGLKGSENK